MRNVPKGRVEYSINFFSQEIHVQFNRRDIEDKHRDLNNSYLDQKTHVLGKERWWEGLVQERGDLTLLSRG